MGVSLSKNNIVPIAEAAVKAALAKGATPEAAQAKAAALTNIGVGLGWDVSNVGAAIDLDASVVAVGADGKAVTDGFVFYNKLTAFDGKIRHNGDNLTGKGEGDDETIDVNLDLPTNVNSLVFAVTIHEAQTRGQDFDKVAGAFIRVVDKTSGDELARYSLSENGGGNDTMIFGELRRTDDSWAFAATSAAQAGGLEAIVAKYAVSI